MFHCCPPTRSSLLIVTVCLRPWSLQAPCKSESQVASQVRNWRALDVDAFAAELQCLELVAAPPSDVESAVNAYNTTLRALLDKHAPAEIKRVRTRASTTRWYDRECRVTKRTTRKLERRYRRLRTAESRAAWRHQFDVQRRLY